MNHMKTLVLSQKALSDVSPIRQSSVNIWVGDGFLPDGLTTPFTLIAGLLVFSGLLSPAPARAQTLWVPSGSVGVSNTNNVGVGTAGPNTTLTVYAEDPVLSIVMPGGEFGRSSGIDFYGTFGYASNGDKGTRRFAQIRVGSEAPNPWEGAYFSILGITPDGGSASEVLHINTWSGNVGIGTTSPATTLHVRGAAGQDVPMIVESQTHNSYLSLRNGYGDNSLSAFDNTLFVGGGGVAGPIYFRNGWDVNVALSTNGNVGIGTTSPTHKLSVNGTIRAKEVIVDTGWSDYVFSDDYELAPLSEVEAHIKSEKHLPGIPSAADVAEHGVNMGDMQAKLLAKVEELTLHLIRIEKENDILRQRVQRLESTSLTP